MLILSLDYGESHYIGPIEKDQPKSEAWVNGFEHTGFYCTPSSMKRFVTDLQL